MQKFKPFEKFEPDRFREARLSRGLSANDIAAAVGITRQAVSKYETGLAEPSSQTLNAIADFLEMPISYFYKPLSIQGGRGTTFYRSLKTNSSKAKDIMNVKSSWAAQIADILSEDIIFPEVDLPSLPDLHREYTLDDIEELAAFTRNYWKLGTAPIANMSRLLESHGVIVATIKTGHVETDACSAFINSRPFIFLDIEKECAVRTRFNMAHELGHLLLHGYITQVELEDKKLCKRIEQEANRFASCFLLPRNEFLADIRSTALESFLPLKKKWKVSIQAMVYRCQELNIFSDSQLIYIQKQLSARRWKKNEPYDDEWSCETAIVLQKALKMLIDRGDYTKEAFVSLLRLPAKEIEELCSLPKGYLTPKEQGKALVIDFLTRKIIE